MLSVVQPRFASALRFFRDSKNSSPSTSAWRAALRLGLDKQWLEQWSASRKRLSLANDPYLTRWLELADQSSSTWEKLENIHAGQTIVCAGSGPSLNRMDLGPLDNQVVIGANYTFKILDRIRPKIFHAMVQDSVRIKEIAPLMKQIEGYVHLGTCGFDKEHSPPAILESMPRNFSVYLPKSNWELNDAGEYVPTPIWDASDCGTDPRNGFYYGYSIIFSMIQLAAYLGAKRIVCIGIEMDYSRQPNFVPGVQHVWPDFSYETHAKTMFEMLREKLTSRGIELVNSTPGGKVDALVRMKLADAIR